MKVKYKFNLFFLFLIVISIFLYGCGETEKQVNNDNLELFEDDEVFEGITEAQGTGGETPKFAIQNSSKDDLFSVDYDGDVTIPEGNFMIYGAGNMTYNGSCMIIKGEKSTLEIC